MGPDWNDMERRLSALTVRELRAIGREWFAGCLGGASSKREIVQEMVDQMRYWWGSCGDFGRGRVRLVLEELDG